MEVFDANYDTPVNAVHEYRVLVTAADGVLIIDRIFTWQQLSAKGFIIVVAEQGS